MKEKILFIQSKDLKGYQNFCNKLWNSSRFILMNLPEDFQIIPVSKLLNMNLEIEDTWILNRLNLSIEETTKTLEEYKFHLTTNRLYTFCWHEFCDWYIEFTKARLFVDEENESKQISRQVLCLVLGRLLDLLHPFMPFITEEIYSFFSKYSSSTKQSPFLAEKQWPKPLVLLGKTKKIATSLEVLQEAIYSTRLLRANVNIPPDKKVNLCIRSDEKNLENIIHDKQIVLQRLAKASSISFYKEYTPSKDEAVEIFSQGEVYISLKGLLDTKKEIERLQLDLNKTRNLLERSSIKLKNKNFTKKAPKNIIEKEKKKIEEYSEKIKITEKSLHRLQK